MRIPMKIKRKHWKLFKCT